MLLTLTFKFTLCSDLNRNYVKFLNRTSTITIITILTKTAQNRENIRNGLTT